MTSTSVFPSLAVVIVRGLPGSGKTYFATRAAEAIGQDKVVLLDPDAVDLTTSDYARHVASQIAEGVDASLHLYRYLRARAYRAIADGKIIIWNQPFTNLEIFRKMVSRLQDQARAHQKSLTIVVVEVEVDAAVAEQRVLERKRRGGHGPSAEAWHRFTNAYSSFAGLGFKTIKIRGDQDVAQSVATLLAALPGKNSE